MSSVTFIPYTGRAGPDCDVIAAGWAGGGEAGQYQIVSCTLSSEHAQTIHVAILRQRKVVQWCFDRLIWFLSQMYRFMFYKLTFDLNIFEFPWNSKGWNSDKNRKCVFNLFWSMMFFLCSQPWELLSPPSCHLEIPQCLYGGNSPVQKLYLANNLSVSSEMLDMKNVFIIWTSYNL